MNFISIQGAKEHHLKDISVQIPKYQITIITGVSGSGKTSLAFDTLYAAGQRKFNESLSSYIRQYLGKTEKPKVDQILNISPPIAISQKSNNTNSRSTVGTYSHIDDYLRLLFAKIGKIQSPITGKYWVVEDEKIVWEKIISLENNEKIFLLQKIAAAGGQKKPALLQETLDKGYFQLLCFHEQTQNFRILNLEEEKQPKIALKESVYIVLDQIYAQNNPSNQERVFEAAKIGFLENNLCTILIQDPQKKEKGNIFEFKNKLEEEGVEYVLPQEELFAFNNALGACESCQGTGLEIGVAMHQVCAEKHLSIKAGVVDFWRYYPQFLKDFLMQVKALDFPVEKPFYLLSREEKKLLWYGNKEITGVLKSFEKMGKEIGKIALRTYQKKYEGKTFCQKCRGTRLKKNALYIKVQDLDIGQWRQMSIENLLNFLKNANWSDYEKEIAKYILPQLHNRLSYLVEVGLPYLSLDRMANSLSGGEIQRIHLANNLGNALVDTLYILDEPSIGLHPKDSEKLFKVIEKIKNLGNTVVIVEHDPDLMLAADHLIDLGPGAGKEGGHLLFSGKPQEILLESKSVTGYYLKNGLAERKVKKPNQFISLIEAYTQNLKGITCAFPLEAFTVITGPSGAGKSSLVNAIIVPIFEDPRAAEDPKKYGIPCKKIEDFPKNAPELVYIGQDAIGRSSRSNALMYIGAFDAIRQLFAKQQMAQRYNLTASSFSFNSKGGRCEECQGEGKLKIDLQFLADVHVICEVCKGKRFEPQVLDVLYKGKNISDILEMGIVEGLDFFQDQPKISKYLEVLVEVGLGYLQMGQTTNTFSGGEAQRLKLAGFLLEKESHQKKIFIFDEPSTGLHLKDIEVLLHCFDKLLEKGNTILAIEHHTGLIARADWMIELGPEGGEKGGEILFEGSIEEAKKDKKSIIAPYLK